MFFAIVVSSCEEENANPIDGLKGKCLEAKVITSWGCTSAVFVQLLNAKTGTKTFYEGKDYENVILLSSLPDNLDLGADYSKTFYFTIDMSNNFESCTKFNPCQMIAVQEPSPVTIKVCGSSFSNNSCPSAE
ncbi:hypothetical protein AAE02nite_12060 [Adhaeribacter aerolatus]|uniref:Uncharacterized protein n=2 Tax=Adhaeribacter aerolatus TaxID=670289 RepID=A0A512AUZ3_9BACT|nr:hypothetical protein AAE02nite_12060 [Adhaeribacter aerolatus]